jgi:hypothetical protein
MLLGMSIQNILFLNKPCSIVIRSSQRPIALFDLLNIYMILLERNIEERSNAARDERDQRRRRLYRYIYIYIYLVLHNILYLELKIVCVYVYRANMHTCLPRGLSWDVVCIEYSQLYASYRTWSIKVYIICTYIYIHEIFI